MAAKFRLFDDMHPRSFPNEKKQFGKITAAVVPKPTLPGVSIMVDKNKLAKAAPKKSFIKWKQQHEALFEPKKFHTTNQTTAVFNRKKIIPIKDTAAVAPKFELDFHKATADRQGTHEEYQQHEYDCTKIRNNYPANVGKPEFQSMMTFSQLNRVARSEATSINVPLEGQPYSHQLSLCGCRCVAIAPTHQQHANPSQIQSNALDNNHGTQSELQLIELSETKDTKPKKPLTSEALADIVEEQIEIVQQQKHILLQQSEIFNLQYQIEKLLLMNNGLNNKSPNKQLQCSPIRKCITSSPIVQPNALPIENSATQAVVNCPDTSPKARKSIGVMTSFCGNLNEVWSPNRNHQNPAPEEDSHKDTMLERINKIIKNSPPMINHRRNNGTTDNCIVSPKRTDINISSQTLIYKTSTRNNVSVYDPTTVTDRSFALHLLDMKYHPDTPATNTHRMNPRRDVNEKTKRSSPKSNDNDFVHSNISPDKYDYLIRHGLLKK